MRQRKKLEPIGNFALLVTAVHLVLGGGLWWWFQSSRAKIQASPGKDIAWMSPADFAPAADVAAAPPEPAKETPLAIDPPKSEPPAPQASTKSEPEEDVPKAVAIDPAKAAEIMAKAMAAEQQKAVAETPPVPSPAKVDTPPPPPPPAPEPVKSLAAGTPAPTTAPPPVIEPPLREKPKPVEPPKPTAPPPPARQDPGSAPPLPATDVSRFITISHLTTEKPKESPKVASLLDMAALDAAGTSVGGEKTGIRLDEVDRAIQDAFLRNWTPPQANKLPENQRTAHVDVKIDRTGKLVSFKPAKTSGNEELDTSVLEAANRLDKIGTPLPATYPYDLYEFQVNFHVE